MLKADKKMIKHATFRKHILRTFVLHKMPLWLMIYCIQPVYNGKVYTVRKLKVYNLKMQKDKMFMKTTTVDLGYNEFRSYQSIFWLFVTFLSQNILFAQFITER